MEMLLVRRGRGCYREPGVAYMWRTHIRLGLLAARLPSLVRLGIPASSSCEGESSLYEPSHESWHYCARESGIRSRGQLDWKVDRRHPQAGPEHVVERQFLRQLRRYSHDQGFCHSDAGRESVPPG